MSTTKEIILFLLSTVGMGYAVYLQLTFSENLGAQIGLPIIWLASYTGVVVMINR